MQKKSFMVFILKVATVIFVGLTTITVFFFSLGILLAVLAGFTESSLDSATLPPEYKILHGKKGEKLLSLPISGMILGEKEEEINPLGVLSGGGVTYGYDLKKQLMDASEDEGIKGVILEINSPGGTIYGARAITDGVSYYKEKTNRPVIAIIKGLGASGAYWSAVSADAIYADYGSTIGSIGVLFGPFQYYNKVVSEDGGALVGGIVTQNGIETTYITAGKSKDIGNPYRQLTQDELATMQRSVNNEYNDFVSFVSKRRNISGSEIRDKIGAMIYENQSARDLHLIDGTKNKQDAYAELAKRANISGDFQVVGVKKEPTFAQMFLESFLQKRSTPIVSSLCLSHLSSAILVYFGDISSLCR